MPRKKTVSSPLHQPIRLSGDVTVDVFAPAEKWPVIQWIGKYVIIAVDEASLPSIAAGHFALPAPVEAAPADTPERAAARAALAAQFPAAEIAPKKPLTAGELAGANAIDFTALVKSVEPVDGFIDEDV